VLETERTYKACRGVLRALEHAQNAAYEDAGCPSDNPSDETSNELGRAMREFQNAARAELEVNGPEWPWVQSGSVEPSETAD
jgi:hypothetical protein